jgi:hypothetical protein
MNRNFVAAFIIAMAAPVVAAAETFEEMCLRVSEEWGTEGDVASQCSCLDEKSAGDSAVRDELTRLADTMSSDAEAYEAGSDEVKSLFDACSVDN